MKRALIAMSGGVDSSVAALLMKEGGYDCTSATMRMCCPAAFQGENLKGCCSDRDEDDAAFVCHQLSIPHECVCFPGSSSRRSSADSSRNTRRDARRIPASTATVF